MLRRRTYRRRLALAGVGQDTHEVPALLARGPNPCRRHYDRFVAVGHPLLESNVKSAIESAASRHLGRRWVSHAFTDLNERASHPCGVLHGEPFSVFAKLDTGDNAEEKFQAELSGLALLRDRARIAIPTPIGTGLLRLDHGSLLLTEALRNDFETATSTKASR